MRLGREVGVQFLTPGLFDAAIALVIAIGLIAAAARIYRDFRSGPRWSDMPPDAPAEQPDSTDEEPDEEETTHA